MSSVFETIGFTGTADGMNLNQVESFTDLISIYRPDVFRHGICIGADATAHWLVRQYSPNSKIIGHPGLTKKGSIWKRASLVEQDCDSLEDPDQFLNRNQKIVSLSKILIATPKSYNEEVRSGTWATIRYARKAGIPIYIIYPDGKIVKDLTSPP